MHKTVKREKEEPIVLLYYARFKWCDRMCPDNISCHSDAPTQDVTQGSGGSTGYCVQNHKHRIELALSKKS